jgi:hypothetical protein
VGCPRRPAPGLRTECVLPVSGCDKRWYLNRRGSIFEAGSVSSEGNADLQAIAVHGCSCHRLTRLPHVPQAQTVRRTVESSREIFDCADVNNVWYFQSNYDAGVPPASFCVNGSQGHLLVTQTYLSRQATSAPFTSRAASAAGGFVLTAYPELSEEFIPTAGNGDNSTRIVGSALNILRL